MSPRIRYVGAIALGFSMVVAAAGGPGVIVVAQAQADDDDASATPDPDRDQDCIRALADLVSHGPWDNDDSDFDGFALTTTTITYDAHTYTVTTTMPSVEGADRCLLSWNDGAARELWPEYDEELPAYSVMNAGGWKAKLDDGGGMAAWMEQ